jgi:hypothetical protein
LKLPEDPDANDFLKLLKLECDENDYEWTVRNLEKYIVYISQDGSHGSDTHLILSIIVNEIYERGIDIFLAQDGQIISLSTENVRHWTKVEQGILEKQRTFEKISTMVYFHDHFDRMKLRTDSQKK